MIVSETQLIFTLIFRIRKDPDDTPGSSFQLVRITLSQSAFNSLLAAVSAISLLSFQAIPKALVVVISDYQYSAPLEHEHLIHICL